MENPTCPTGLVPPAETKHDLSGALLGDFQLLRKLGQGGMGQVYLAEQVSLKRKVAVKVMRADLAANETAVKRFKGEAEAVARLTHANIVQIYAIGNQDGLQYLALEFVEGTSLGAYLARKGPLPVPLVTSILRQAAAALQHAGENGIVHRDIKPENILITSKALVKVTDFGLARCTNDEQEAAHLTQSGVILGTPLYMSPEQVHGKPVDTRTDIYSLGVTAYHMLTGKPPYQGQSAFDLALKHVQGTPRPLQEVRADLPAELCRLVARMMAKNPEERFQNGKELLRALAGVPQSAAAVGARTQDVLEIGDERTQIVRPTKEQTAPITQRKTKLGRPRRRRMLYLATGLAVLAMGVAAALGISYKKQHAAQVRQGPSSPNEPRQPPADPPPLPPPPVKPPPPPQPPDPPAKAMSEEEKKLRRMLEKEFNPGEPFQMRAALNARMEMSDFLLRQPNRLHDAESYFKELRASSHPPINVLGRVGEAIVLGLQGKAKESNEAFRQARKSIPPVLVGKPLMAAAAFYNPLLKPWILKVLDKNAAVDPLTPDLQEIQKRLKDTPSSD